MNVTKVSIAILLSTLFILSACSPIKTPVSNQYKLEMFGTKIMVKKKSTSSILISQPDAMAGYQTEQMYYIQKPFELSTFVHNAWISSPANMLYPLIMQSLEKTGYFNVVASGPYVDKADYRIDTQLIELQQNFLTKPSTLDFSAKVLLTHISDGRVIASHTFNQHISCHADTPYGGVVAANEATQAFTKSLSRFVVTEVTRDEQRVIVK